MRSASPGIRNNVRATATIPEKPAVSSTHAHTAQGVPIDVAPRAISKKEFLRFQALIYRESGIWLSDVKSGLLTGRLSKRLRALRLTNFSEYHDRVTLDEEERRAMLDAITTNETQFFREPAHFQLLEQQVLPAWQASARAGRRARTIQVWSAGCSTGQEAYSLAMLLVDRLSATEGWSVEILATDLSRRVLTIAEAGEWDAAKAHDIPPRYLQTFMLKGCGENRGKIKAAPAIRVVRTLRLNLNDTDYPNIGKFDLIFCRNVLIYFDAESRKRVIGRLLGHLAPEGYFFVGHAESLTFVNSGLRSVIPTVYTFPENRSLAKHAVRR
jgi:chemotaxis protein methyltransferase CheR